MKRLALVTVALLLLLVPSGPVHQSGRWLNLVPAAWLFTGVPLDASYTPTPIRSVTDISISIPNGSFNATQSVSVTAVYSLLVWDGQTTDCQNGPLHAWASASITSNSVVTAGRQGNSCGIIYNAQLVEFLGNFVRSSGCGSITIASGQSSATATIPAITVGKTVLAKTGVQTDMAAGTSTTPTVDQFVRLSKTNTTTLTAQRAATGVISSVSAGYCYLEFR